MHALKASQDTARKMMYIMLLKHERLAEAATVHQLPE